LSDYHTLTLAVLTGTANAEEPLLITDLAASSAIRTGIRSLPLLSTTAPAVPAGFHSWNFDPGLHTRSALFEFDLQIVTEICSTLGAPGTRFSSTAKKIVEDIPEYISEIPEICKSFTPEAAEVTHPH
jgi:hypothetical protein